MEVVKLKRIVPGVGKNHNSNQCEYPKYASRALQYYPYSVVLVNLDRNMRSASSAFLLMSLSAVEMA